MRYITLNVDTDKDMYRKLYDSLLGNTEGYDTKHSGRVVAKVLDKFEALGTPRNVQTGPDQSITTFDLSASGTLAFEDAEFAILSEAFAKTKWTGIGIRDALKVQDVLDGAPTKDPNAPALVVEPQAPSA